MELEEKGEMRKWASAVKAPSLNIKYGIRMLSVHRGLVRHLPFSERDLNS